MVAQNKIRLTRHFPVVTLVVVAIAVVVRLVPGLNAVLVYDRSAILNGELWRLMTGHWVHFSTAHFVYDVAVFGIAGWMIEDRGSRRFGWLCVLSPVAIGVALLLFEPHLNICGGLSGIATAAVVFLAFNGLAEKGAWRWFCLAVLIATCGKILVEAMTGKFVFLELADSSVAPVPLNHLVGAVTALALYAVNNIPKRRVAS